MSAQPTNQGCDREVPMQPKTGAPFAFAVEGGKVREFATSVRSADPAYVDPDAERVIPPTFPIRTMFLAGPDESVRDDRRDIKRILHAEQEFLFFGAPPSVGRVLTAQQEQGPIVEKQGRRGGHMTFVEIDTNFRDETGELVMQSRFITVTVEAKEGEQQ